MRHSISRRLFIQILLTIMVGAAVVTALDLIHQYRTAVNLQERDRRQIEQHIVPVVSHLVWVLNEEQVRQIARSVFERAEVHGVTVTLDDGTTLFEMHDPENAAHGEPRVVVWPLEFSRGTETMRLGTLEVEFASVRHYAFGADGLAFRLLPDTLVLAAVILSVAWSLRRRISYPLRRLRRDIDAADFAREMPSWWETEERRDPTEETRRVREVLGETARRVRQQIDERRQTEAALAASVAEKTMLLKEIHHRVKNNLQMVVSLLSLQRRAITNEDARRVLEDSGSRVASMALVHELLYREDLYSAIDLADYMRSLGGLIVGQTSHGDRRIRVHYAIESQYLELDVAIPLSLIANELLTNAVKHAFRDRTQGNITITGVHDTESGRTTVTICDDGGGLPEDWEQLRTRSLGLQIVSNLCEQIRAELSIESGESGTCFSLVFSSERSFSL